MTISPIRNLLASDFLTAEAEFDPFVVPVFTLPTVPPGYVWTVSLSAVLAANLTVGDNSPMPPNRQVSNELLQNAVFTLYRNGAAEWTWVGLSALCNLQLFGNDVVIINMHFPPTGGVGIVNFPQPLSLSMVGYSGTTDEVSLTVPFLSTTVTSNVSSPTTIPAEPLQISSFTSAAAGSHQLMSDPGDLELHFMTTVSATISATSTGAGTADCLIQDGVGNDLCNVGVNVLGTATQPGNQTMSLSLDLAGFVFFPPVNGIVSISGTVSAFRATGTILWSTSPRFV